MAYKILCSVRARSISILNCKENYINISGDKLKDLRNRWKNFISDALIKIASNNSAVLHIYSADDAFHAPELQDSQTKTKVCGESRYCTISSPNLFQNDIKKIVSLTEFELSDAWVELMAKDEKSKQDSVEFFESFDEVINGKIEDNSNYECIGSTQDGEEILWNNPNWEKAEEFINEIPKISIYHSFECTVNDKRN